MSEPRTKYLDTDFRRRPKTDLFCYVCQKDIKPDSKYRMIHVIDGGPNVLHPGSEADYVSDAGEMGSHPIGPDCAKRLGLEWSVPIIRHPETV